MPKSTKAKIGALKGWEDEIVALRKRGHPIQARFRNDGKPAKEDIISFLKANGVIATFSQVELLLKKKGERKYLSGIEWAKVLKVLKDYENRGTECGLLMNDNLVSKLTLRKNRARYRREVENLEKLRIDETELPSCVKLQHELQTGNETANGDAEPGTLVGSVLSESTAVATSNNIEQAPNSHNRALANLSSYEADCLRIGPSKLDAESQDIENSMSLGETSIEFESAFSPSDHQLTLASPVSKNNITSNFDFDQFLCPGAPFEIDMADPRLQTDAVPHYPLLASTKEPFFDWKSLDGSSLIFENSSMQSFNIDNTSLGFLGSSQVCTDYIVPNPITLDVSNEISHASTKDFARIVNMALDQGILSGLIENEPLLDHHRLASNLLSLIPSNNFSLPQSIKLSLLQGYETVFTRVLIICIENDFFKDSILHAIKTKWQDKRIQQALRSCLSWPASSTSIKLAKVILEAAITVNDPISVAEILSLDMFDINEVVCEYLKNPITAVGLSVRLKNVEVVKELISRGADVNKTLSTRDGSYSYTVLEHSIGARSIIKERPDIRIVDMLLLAGAQITDQIFAMTLEWEIDDLTARVLLDILSSHHELAFRTSIVKTRRFDVGPANDIDCMSNDFAEKWVPRIIRTCFETKCEKCIQSYIATVESWAGAVIRKGLKDLFKFLMPYITRPGYFLMQAIRANQPNIVELLLKSGADIGYCLPETRTREESDIFGDGPNTPLSEAIRTGNQILIGTFENKGALHYIAKKDDHFQAALNSAAEVGNLLQLRAILSKAPHASSDHLGSALLFSTRKGRDNISVLLLSMGANVNYGMRPYKYSASKSPLYYTIKQRKKQLVKAILERDVHIEATVDSLFLPEVIAWGDLSILEDLISFFGTEALLINNVNYIRRGNYDDTRIEDTLLSMAIKNDNLAIFQYLIDCGCDIADTRLFIDALEDETVFHKLIAIFRERYPKGKKGFGAAVLQILVSRGDMELLDIALTARFDIDMFLLYPPQNCLGFTITSNKDKTMEVVRNLLAFGADPNGIVSRPNKFYDRDEESIVFPQRTAIMEAITVEREDLVILLVKAGADIHRPALLGVKRTPLQQACEVGNMRIVKLLLDMGADPNEPSAIRGGATSLQLCAIGGYCGIAERLLELGADVHAKAAEINGRTALEGAAEHGRLLMLQLLWSVAGLRGFGWQQCESAIKLAEKNGHLGCSELIRDMYVRGQAGIEFM